MGRDSISIEGDWICSDVDCKNLNFARRTRCNRCKKERERDNSSTKHKQGQGAEIGKAAAEKSRGLFSAEDWQCSKCLNVNWARRQTCNMCNAPKFSDVEERTGYGGGYNDRGIVEYKEHDDSDEDYDEFGRKKKRNKRTSKSRISDDSEDDDDGGDLSKYDLWGCSDEEVDDRKSPSNLQKTSSKTQYEESKMLIYERSPNRSKHRSNFIKEKSPSLRGSKRSRSRSPFEGK